MRAARHVEQQAEVELQIDQVTMVNPVEVTATVRCVAGPARLGARFDRIRGSADTIELELTQILAHPGLAVAAVDPVHTALVTLRGAGGRLLASATAGSGWQTIQGSNPPPTTDR